MDTSTINAIADAVATKLRSGGLGFSNEMAESQRRRTVFLNRKHGGLWYFWNGSDDGPGRPEPIDAQYLTCRVEGIAFAKREWEGRDSSKIRLYVQADHPYRIETGVDTVGGKSLLLSLAALSPAQAQGVITIRPQAGTEKESVLFVDVFAEGQSIKTAPMNEVDDWKAVARRAVENCGRYEEPVYDEDLQEAE